MNADIHPWIHISEAMPDYRDFRLRGPVSLESPAYLYINGIISYDEYRDEYRKSLTGQHLLE